MRKHNATPRNDRDADGSSTGNAFSAPIRRRRSPIVVLTGGILAVSIALAGCSAVATTTTTATQDSTSVVQVDATQAADAVLAANQEVHDTSDATEYEEADVIDITLTGTGATVDGESDAVTVDGSTITITAAGTYRFSGSLDDGQVVVDSTGEGTVRLILDGAEVSSSTSSPLVITEADHAVVLLADGTSNSLSDTSAYTDGDEASGALSSAADLTIAGSGSLDVSGNANDGIVSSDGLVILDGTITVDAVDDGLRGKDYLVVRGGTLDVTAGGDGLKSDNEEDETRGFIDLEGGDITVTSAGDGLQAQTDIVITGGTLDVTSGGGADQAVGETSTKGIKSGVITVIEGGVTTVDASDDALHSDGSINLAAGAVSLASGDDGVHADSALLLSGATVDVTRSYEGLESADITVAAGDVTVTSSDDGLNASAGSSDETETAAGGQQGMGGGDQVDDVSLTVSGGTLVVDAGGDGLDSNGTLTITGGTTVVSGPTDNGNGALDANGTFTVSGGTVLAAGSSGMVVSPGTDSAQGWISATLDSAEAAGSVVQILAADGTVVASFTAAKEFSSVVFSSSAIITGAEYSIAIGGAVSGEVVGGLAASGEASSASVVATVTAGEAAAGGMGGGGQGGPR